MITELGYTEADLSLQFGIIGTVTMLMIVPAGYVSDHWGRKAPSVLAAVCSVILAVGYGFATGVVELSILSVIAGVATGFGLGAMTTYTYDIVPTEVRGQFQAFRRAAGEAGAIAGPAVGGVVATLASPSVAQLVFTPLHLVSMLLLIFVARETLHRRQDGTRSIATAR
jgi:AAHS family benzoate transporter-like MFS transporter